MSDALVTYTVEDGLARITLNRPEAKNALSSALMRELAAAFEQAQADSDVRVVLLTGAGDAFCAGVDLKEFGTLSEQPPEPGERPNAWKAMEDCACPIVGAINGPAITGGFELALACDVLIASTQARFADTHARVGVIPGAGLSQRLPRALGVYRAKYLSLTGDFLSAKKAEEWGLVSHVVAPEALNETATRVARDMLSVMPHMLEPYKKLIDEGFATTFGEGMKHESRTSSEQIKSMQPQKGASAAFEAVRERGRGQNN
ncbi:MAG: enoyl-CoA hydratase [Myxococcota bacterium]